MLKQDDTPSRVCFKIIQWREEDREWGTDETKLAVCWLLKLGNTYMGVHYTVHFTFVHVEDFPFKKKGVPRMVICGASDKMGVHYTVHFIYIIYISIFICIDKSKYKSVYLFLPIKTNIKPSVEGHNFNPTPTLFPQIKSC